MAAQELHLVKRPNGLPKISDFAIREKAIPDLKDGEVEVTSLIISVDPYMRPRLSNEADQALNAPMMGPGIGRVSKSRNPKFKEGDLVKHGGGFTTHFISGGKDLTPLKRDPALPLSVYQHALGGTGLTAYGGILETGALKSSDYVYVSTAGGAVGSVASQIARIKGCTVVGSTGTDDKAQWLRDEAKLNAVINYKKEDLGAALDLHLPKGIDLYFENVGGEHLDTVLTRMRPRGRIPLCGMISTYNGEGVGVKNLASMIYRQVRLEGFVAYAFGHLREQFEADMTGWLKSGEMKYQETILFGFDKVAEGLIGLFEGKNAGKMMIQVSE